MIIKRAICDGQHNDDGDGGCGGGDGGERKKIATTGRGG